MAPGVRNAVIAVSMSVAAAAAQAQEQPLEYQVEAAYLYNFVKFVDWPTARLGGRHSRFAPPAILPSLPHVEQIVRDEVINGHQLAVRTIEAPQAAV
jgi:hypothetical protein